MAPDLLSHGPLNYKRSPNSVGMVTCRGAPDRIIRTGGYIAVDTGGPPDANLLPIPEETAGLAMGAAPCFGRGTRVNACPNARCGSPTLLRLNLFYHNKLDTQDRNEKYQKIMVVIDISSYSKYTQAYAASLAERLLAESEIVNDIYKKMDSILKVAKG